MPEYRFDVLCMNDNTCHTVMDDMEYEYPNQVHKITDMKKRNGSGDHFVKLTCEDIDDADRIGQEMLQRHSNFIRSITVKPL